MMLRKIIMKKPIFLLFFVLFSLFYNNKAKCEEKFVKRIVVMPFENLTGNKTAVKIVQGEIINELRNKGYEIVAEDDVKKFYLNEGLRYTKYVTPDITKKMKEKMNVEAVLLGVLTSYSEKTERMGIYLTLVDAEECRILWVNHVSFTTQDYAKLLGIKPFSTFEEFRRMVIRELLKDFQESNFMKNERFYKVAVLPFVNKYVTIIFAFLKLVLFTKGKTATL
jgi:TolB-like protein